MDPRYRRPELPHFYRYGRVDNDERCSWLRSLLVDHELYVPLASELNDLREARPRLMRKSATDIEAFMRRSAVENWAGSPEHIRRAFEERIPEIVRTVGVDGLLEKTREEFHAMLTRNRIYSMSKRWNNLSMWEWYGDKHRGYCVEFKNLPYHQTIRAVEYVAEPVLIDWMNLAHAQAHLLFFQKHSDWSNEEEVRAVIPRSEGGPVFTLNPEAISRVILGKDMAPERAAQIRAWAAERKPFAPVAVARWNAFDAQLEVVD